MGLCGTQVQWLQMQEVHVNILLKYLQMKRKAGDIIIVNLGAGAGNDGHTAILAEDWKGYSTSIVEMGGMNSNGVGIGRVDWSFGYLLNGGDVYLCQSEEIEVIL